MVVGEKILATNLGFSSHFAHGDSRTWNSWSFLGRSATGAFPWSDSLNNFLGECDVYILYIYTIYILYIYTIYIHYIYILYIYTIYIYYIYTIYILYIYTIKTIYIHYIYILYIYYIYILYTVYISAFPWFDWILPMFPATPGESVDSIFDSDVNEYPYILWVDMIKSQHFFSSNHILFKLGHLFIGWPEHLPIVIVFDVLIKVSHHKPLPRSC